MYIAYFSKVDLVAGAPHYGHKGNGTAIEIGRVYVFYHEGSVCTVYRVCLPYSMSGSSITMEILVTVSEGDVCVLGTITATLTQLFYFETAYS